MASLCKTPGDKFQINFRAPSGRRQSIRLGKCSATMAANVLRHLQCLLVAHRLGEPPDPATVEWLALIDDKLHRFLVKHGLVTARGARTIGELCEWYLESRKGNCRPSTTMNLQRATLPLVRYFGADCRLRLIGPDQAEKFRAWLLRSGSRHGGPLAPTTVSRVCRRARQIYAAAVRRGWVGDNPFAEMKHWCETNPSRDVYVTAELMRKLLDATADAELRAILALVRFAGLRCPSEVQPLRWEGVDFEAGLLRVQSPKTARYDGHAARLVPLFPEVRPHLDALWDKARDGAVLLFPRHQGSRAAVTARLEALCRKIGIALWAKPFINMRASCERDLLRTRPIDEVAAWLGHSPTIALRHYNRAAAEERARAAGVATVAAHHADSSSASVSTGTAMSGGSQCRSGSGETARV